MVASRDEFGILVIVTFSAYSFFVTSQLSVVWENQSTWQKPPPNSQVTGNFLTYPSWYFNLGSGERQLVVSGNALDCLAIIADPSRGKIKTVYSTIIFSTSISESGEFCTALQRL